MRICSENTIIIFFLIFSYGNSSAQKSLGNFYNEIKKYDISQILTAENIIAEDRENTKDKVKRVEPIGFIGYDYQRFYIHFTSVVQNPNNRYEYFATGKTKVKETIRPFKGSILIKRATIGKNEVFPNYQEGFATCEVILLEDKKITSTGIIRGKMEVGYIIDSKQNFRYNALLFYTDGFSNNQFKGTWTSFKTNKSKKCNFGDYRIPDSGDLDIGAGEFSPDPKYFDKGWKSYMLSLYGETEHDVELGRNEENRKWWQ